jgi:nucleotide-binding universal stress UspA family protein
MNHEFDHTRPVIVGVDGSAASLEAVRWAAAEANLRQLPLRLLHAYADPAETIADFEVAQTAHEALRNQAQRWLRDALYAVHEIDPELQPRIDVAIGDPVPTMVERTKDGSLLVVGSHGLGGFTGMLVGSTAIALAARAHCPVAVVRAAPLGGHRVVGPIVVGIDGSPASEEAISFAFHEASLRGCGLIAVHTWNEVFLDTELSAERISFDTSVLEQQERELLAQRLAGWQEKYPDVAVRRVVEQNRPVRALLEHAEDAQLILVGSRGRSGFGGMLLGSTSQALVHYAPCPVIIARPESQSTHIHT